MVIVRRTAGIALKGMLQADAPVKEVVIARLIRALDDQDTPVRANALRALARIRHHDRRILPLLIERVSTDHSSDVRWAAADGLAFFPDDTRVVPTLVRALDDTRRQVRKAAVWSLGTLGRAAKPALPRLRALRASASGLAATIGRAIKQIDRP